MRAHGSQWFSHKMNNRHPLQLKKSKSWEPFWSYQLNSTANPAHLPQNWAKLAKSAVLFSWYVQNGSQDLNFFNCHGCQTFYFSWNSLPKPSLKIGLVNKAFLFWYWQRLKFFFLRNRTFLFFKIESWNFQNKFEKEFRETSQNFNSIRQPI